MAERPRNYRVYGYDSAQRSVESDWIEALNDEDAILQASALGFTKSELWNGDRLVAQLGEEARRA